MKDQRTLRVPPNSLPIRQEGSAPGEEQWIEKENLALAAASFEPSGEEDDLWCKGGIWCGRKAALQKLGQTPHLGTTTDK
jgi:hypothetical protein